VSTWNIDPAHSSVEFTVRHMMVTTVRGNFGDFSGKLDFDPERPEQASVEAVIQAASINTGTADRDAHLRSADFFEVEKFPTLTFKSTRVDAKDPMQAKVHGDLTMHGITRPVTLDVAFLGQQKNPFTGMPTVGFEASVTINREDFGLTWNQALEAGGVLVSKDVKISLDVQAVPEAETASV
jgi:polyisoprenoid-binding protein YceI